MAEAISPTPPPAAPSPLGLLVRVNAWQAWRRMKALREQSRLLTAIILLFVVGYAGLSFLLFYKGLRFLSAFPGLGAVLAERLLYLLFAFLFGLLLLSNLVISYTNLFRNRETAFLLTLPVPAQTIFQWKFIESALLASWAFLFLIAPLLAAFGLTRGVPWHFYPFTVLLIGLFIGLPGLAGAWAAIHLARWLDRKSFQIAAVAAVGALVMVAAWAWHENPEPIGDTEIRVLPMLDQLLVKTRFALFPFLPSYWLTSGVLQWAEGATAGAGFFALVLLSHVGFFGCLAFTRLGHLFYDGASVTQSRASVWGQWEWFRARRARKTAFTYPTGVMEKLFNRLAWLDRDTRALLVKDARMFWRDTTQWGQSVLLFGLLGVYIINLRHFTAQLTSPYWVNLVSHMNLAACALNLATLTTRFVYPQFSLEGRRLWIVGLAPMGLARVVKTKYWLGSCAALTVTLSLITLSSHLLNLSWGRIAFFGLVIAVMTFALNGLAAGLGVLYPNFKENNPSKIVSGFGGTLCLVLSFVYIVAAVLAVAFGTTGWRQFEPSAGVTAASLLVFALLSLAVGWLPLRLGLRQLPKFEF
jgi:ABC-2 type transport system permease protein